MNNDSQILTFLYHEVVDNPSDSGFQRKSALPYKHAIQEFKDNIDIIVSNSNKITTVEHLNWDLPKRATLITFDDGGKSSMLSADYLEKHNLRGHFFITTGLIGDRYFLKEDEILELHRRGHIIGSHSHSHPNVFRSLSSLQMMEEWSKSKEILENILDTNIDSCSIPGGDANKDAYTTAINCGYKYIFDSEPVTKLRRMEHALILGRICPKKDTRYSTIKKLSHFRGIRRQYLLRKFKNFLKVVLYPIYSRIHNASKHEGQ